MQTSANKTLVGLMFSELVGTALLVGVGLSIVILNFGRGGPVASIVISAGQRRALTGFLFGTTGALIALSAVGKKSGAHINPVVSVAFWLEGVLPRRALFGYIASQLCGAVLGALPLLAWGPTGSSVSYGATIPGPGGALLALVGETLTTFALVLGLLSMVGNRRLRRFTPAMFPVLYAVMVYLEAPWSGTSTNPARSLGPAAIAGVWPGFWVYCIGPGLGTVAAILVRRAVPKLRDLEIDVAKIYHFELDPFAPPGTPDAGSPPQEAPGVDATRRAGRRHRREGP